MDLRPLLLNSRTWHWVGHLLFLVALCLLILSATLLAETKPMKFLKSLSGKWQTTLARSKNLTAKIKDSGRILKSIWYAVATRTKGPIIKIAAMCVVLGLSHSGVFYVGYLYHDSKEFHDTYVLVNAVVDSQNGDYVTYHFEDDPTREPYTLNFTCSRWKPHFKPHQIIAKMTYARKGECESLDGPQYVLKLRRLNGIPILDQGE